jgi:hypothetical protein
MRIVVNHLTRMQPGYICVAGVDTSTGKHVRPVLTGRLSRHLLACKGGPFDIAHVVDLGPVRHVGYAPEVEDYEFRWYEAQRVTVESPDGFWKLLEGVAQQRLTEIFGGDLQQNGNGCTLPLGHGAGSLGCLIPADRPQLYKDGYGGIRLRFTDGEFRVAPSVTDLRLYNSDHKTIKSALVEDVQRRINAGVRIILSVGVGRPWKRSEDAQEHHWLQVNGIHLADNPVWQVGEEDDEDGNSNPDDLPF